MRFVEGPEVSFQGNDAELYFEADDYEEFLSGIDGLELVHPPMEHSWGQRGVRFYDPDGHIIEVGETIAMTVKRFSQSGMSAAGIAVRMDVKEEYVRQWLDDLAASEDV